MINSHYVPQFILRNFYKDNKITYCDIQNKTVSLRNPKSVFAEEGYYPEAIEKSLCKDSENQFAKLFHDKLENAGCGLSITAHELFIIKKYLIISSFRYKFEEGELEKERKNSLGITTDYDNDRMLNKTLECKNLDDMFSLLTPYLNGEIFEHDKPGMINNDFHISIEVKDILNSYFIFAKASGSEKFIIPDVGRGAYFGPIRHLKLQMVLQYYMQTGAPWAMQMMAGIGPRDYTIYPLSKDLVIINMCLFYKMMSHNSIKGKLELPKEYSTVNEILGFGDANLVASPETRITDGIKEYLYEVKMLRSPDVAFLNDLMIAQARKGIVCAGLDTIKMSISNINNYCNRDYSFMVE